MTQSFNRWFLMTDSDSTAVFNKTMTQICSYIQSLSTVDSSKILLIHIIPCYTTRQRTIRVLILNYSIWIVIIVS